MPLIFAEATFNPEEYIPVCLARKILINRGDCCRFGSCFGDRCFRRNSESIGASATMRRPWRTRTLSNVNLGCGSKDRPSSRNQLNERGRQPRRLTPMRKTLFEGKFLRLLDDDSWEFTDRPASAGVVSVVAIDGEKLLLVEQFRHAQQAAVVSFPGGLIDRAEAGRRQETAIEAGTARVAEETGYEAGKIEELVSGPISPGMTTEAVTFVLAQDLVLARRSDAGRERKHFAAPGAAPALFGIGSVQSARGSQIDLQSLVGLWFVVGTIRRVLQPN